MATIRNRADRLTVNSTLDVTRTSEPLAWLSFRCTGQHAMMPALAPPGWAGIFGLFIARVFPGSD